MSAFALRATARQPSRGRLAEPKLTLGSRERRLERETGIEPATNSLEGCDSTTELLPPTRSLTSLFPSHCFARRRAGPPRYVLALRAYRRRCSSKKVTDSDPPTFPVAAETSLQPTRGLPPEARVTADNRERRVVAREGLEPSKPLGRQIYSLLRLTASLPRRLAVLFGNAMFRSYSKDPDVLTVMPMELAKGFEPPTG